MAPSERTVSAAFHLTRGCNLRCTYCYTGEKVGVAMTEETADRAVGFSLQEARRQEADHLEVVFFGGEPLLEHALLCRVADRVVEGADGLRVSFKMSTNGLLLTEQVVSDLARRHVFVSISIDGPPDVQDLQRPGPGGRAASAILREVVPRLLRWNPCANVTCVTTPATAGRFDECVRWIFDQGFAYVSTTLDYSASWTMEDLQRLRASVERLAEWYVARTAAGEKLYLSCFDERINTWTRGPLDECERCSAGVRQFSIGPSGRLYPCVQFVHEDLGGEFALGDVFRGWDEARRVAYRAAIDAPKAECAGCALVGRCSSWCACVNWQSTGRVDRASPVLCEVERFLIPTADATAERLWRKRDRTFLHKHYNPAFPVLSFAERLVQREVPRV